MTVDATRVVALGGGHGLAVTVRACRPWAGDLVAVVSVADDGGSSGRLRAAEPGLPAPGDLRRCLTTLADPERGVWAAALEARFEVGDLAGHPAGNILLAALARELGDLHAAVDEVASVLGVTATVVPATAEAVDLVGLTKDGAEVFGQVEVEVAGGITDIRLEPPDPEVPEQAIEALAAADLVVLGPGSFYGSVLAAVAAPALQTALATTPGQRVLVHNLFSIDSVAERLAVLDRHGILVDTVVVQEGVPGIEVVGVEVVTADVARPNGMAHDPARLGAVFRKL